MTMLAFIEMQNSDSGRSVEKFRHEIAPDHSESAVVAVSALRMGPQLRSHSQAEGRSGGIPAGVSGGASTAMSCDCVSAAGARRDIRMLGSGTRSS